MELFFIFLIIKEPTRVQIRALERPYYSAEECIRVARIIHEKVKPKHPQLVGALCYTIDEVSDFEYEPAIKR